MTQLANCKKEKKIQQVKPISLPRHLCQMKTHPHGHEASVASIKQQRKFNQPLQNLFPPARVLHPDCKPQLPKSPTSSHVWRMDACIDRSRTRSTYIYILVYPLILPPTSLRNITMPMHCT